MMPPFFDNPRGDNDRKLVAPMRLPIQGEEYFHATLPYPFHANGGHPQCASSPLTLRVRPSDGMLFVHSTAAALYWIRRDRMKYLMLLRVWGMLLRLRWQQFVKDHIVDEYPYEDEM